MTNLKQRKNLEKNTFIKYAVKSITCDSHQLHLNTYSGIHIIYDILKKHSLVNRQRPNLCDSFSHFRSWFSFDEINKKKNLMFEYDRNERVYEKVCLFFIDVANILHAYWKKKIIEDPKKNTAFLSPPKWNRTEKPDHDCDPRCFISWMSTCSVC